MNVKKRRRNEISFSVLSDRGGKKEREEDVKGEREKKGNSLSKMTGACKENKRLYKKRRMGMKSKT
jgi:hypothetical protein